MSDFYGKSISYQGVEFSGSARDVFWHRYIEPFIEDAADRAFNETLRIARDRQFAADIPLKETAGLLVSLSRKSFRRMEDIDQRLRGKGYPNSVPRYDTESEQAKVERFIVRRAEAEVAMLPPPVKADLPPEVRDAAGSIGPSWSFVDLKRTLDEVEAYLEALGAQTSRIGHNNPPVELSLAPTQSEIFEARASITDIQTFVADPTSVNISILETAAIRLQALGWKIATWSKWLGEKIASGVVTAVAAKLTGDILSHPEAAAKLNYLAGILWEWAKPLLL